MFKIKKHKFFLFFSCFLVFLFSCFLTMGQGVLAEEKTGAGKALEGLDQTAVEGYLGKSGASPEEAAPLRTDIPSIIGQIVGAVLAFVGLLLLVLIIYGGFIWMTAGGNEEEVKKAISLITQAVIGLVIISAAYLIAQFVGESVVLPFIGAKQ
jgi:uncharacterized membrane protein